MHVRTHAHTHTHYTDTLHTHTHTTIRRTQGHTHITHARACLHTHTRTHTHTILYYTDTLHTHTPIRHTHITHTHTHRVLSPCSVYSPFAGSKSLFLLPVALGLGVTANRMLLMLSLSQCCGVVGARPGGGHRGGGAATPHHTTALQKYPLSLSVLIVFRFWVTSPSCHSRFSHDYVWILWVGFSVYRAQTAAQRSRQWSVEAGREMFFFVENRANILPPDRKTHIL